jgi:hypothetical protein
MGEPHAQTGNVGLSVSGNELCITPIEPSVNGNKQLQQTSVIGLTHDPEQELACADTEYRVPASNEMQYNHASRVFFMAGIPQF